MGAEAPIYLLVIVCFDDALVLLSISPGHDLDLWTLTTLLPLLLALLNPATEWTAILVINRYLTTGWGNNSVIHHKCRSECQ